MHSMQGKWARNGGGPSPVVDFDFKDPDLFKTILTDEERKDFCPVPSKLYLGEAVFHHPLAVHGSLENKSDRWRRSALLNYMPDGTRSDSEAHLTKNSPKQPCKLQQGVTWSGTLRSPGRVAFRPTSRLTSPGARACPGLARSVCPESANCGLSCKAI